MAKKKEGALKVVPIEQEPKLEEVVETSTEVVPDEKSVENPIQEKKEDLLTIEQLIAASRHVSKILFPRKGDKPIQVDSKLFSMASGLMLPIEVPHESPQGFYLAKLLYIGPEGEGDSGLVDPHGNPIASKKSYKTYPAQAVIISKKDFGKMLYLDFDFYINLTTGGKQHDRSYQISGIPIHVIRPHEVNAISDYDIWTALMLDMIKLQHLRHNEQWASNLEQAAEIYRLQD